MKTVTILHSSLMTTSYNYARRVPTNKELSFICEDTSTAFVLRVYENTQAVRLSFITDGTKLDLLTIFLSLLLAGIL